MLWYLLPYSYHSLMVNVRMRDFAVSPEKSPGCKTMQKSQKSRMPSENYFEKSGWNQMHGERHTQQQNNRHDAVASVPH